MEVTTSVADPQALHLKCFVSEAASITIHSGSYPSTPTMSEVRARLKMNLTLKSGQVDKTP